MLRILPAFLLTTLFSCAVLAQRAPEAAPSRAWIQQSNAFTNQLLNVQFQHTPENGSHEGLAEFDPRISDPTLADELAEREQLKGVLAKIDTARGSVSDKRVLQDLDILGKAFDLKFREQDFALKHEVPFLNASALTFQGMHVLLDDQVAAERRPAALVRLRKYAGVEPGYQPFTDLLKARALEQMAKPGVIYPSKGEIETELGRNATYLEGMAALLGKYGIKGWEGPYAKLRQQLESYDAWVRQAILPKARTDFRMPPERYALAFEEYGIDVPPAKIAAMAHAAFAEYQSQMSSLAAQIARANGYPADDYRAVIAQLKKKQITGAAILPFFEGRLHEIEKIIAAQNLVTLPDRPAIIRLATPAETAQSPAPHMSPPAVPPQHRAARRVRAAAQHPLRQGRRGGSLR